MKKFIYILLILPIFFSCHKKNLLNVKPISLPQNGKEIIQGCNNYGFEVFKELDIRETDRMKNIMYSPLSLNMVLLMTYNGAQEFTANEIQNALSLNAINLIDINSTYDTINTVFPIIDKDILLKIANSIWANLGITIKSNFSSDIKKHYKAEVQNLDFSNTASLGIINDWVKEKSEGKINKIADNLNFDLILINVLYFKGQWHTQFDKDLTKNKDFYLADSTKIIVPTMELKDTIKFATSEKYILVELPYSQGNYVMDLILPQNDNTTDTILDVLPDFKKTLDDLTLAEMTIYLPKFEFSYQNEEYADILKLKMPTAFSDSANFLKMLNISMPIEKVIQKTYIKTDEEGTEAVAATGFTFLSAPPPCEIYFNRPFIFIIREVSTNTVMFIGKVANPLNN